MLSVPIHRVFTYQLHCTEAWLKYDPKMYFYTCSVRKPHDTRRQAFDLGRVIESSSHYLALAVFCKLGDFLVGLVVCEGKGPKQLCIASLEKKGDSKVESKSYVKKRAPLKSLDLEFHQHSTSYPSPYNSSIGKNLRSMEQYHV